jgi:hypothetical protein
MEETGLWQKKYQAWGAMVNGTFFLEFSSVPEYGGSGKDLGRGYSPQNVQILRFADVLLMHSELTDGKVIYTCPQTFDDAIPSRSENTGSAVQTKKIYDTMGRPVNGTPAQGIYIVVMEIDGEQVTSKMLIHD